MILGTEVVVGRFHLEVMRIFELSKSELMKANTLRSEIISINPALNKPSYNNTFSNKFQMSKTSKESQV